jgi:hypothetical protein
LKKIFIFLFLFNQLFGFTSFNNRNHPEIKWKQIESDNVVIVYHDPLYDTAEEALKISEATYASLVKTYDLELDDKIQIFISNQDDITNGFSMVGRCIVIWVDANDFVNIFTGRESWLRKVLSHEISHHFVFHSVKGWVDWFFPITALTFPLDFNEGFAMFYSGEEWGYGRSDAALRKAVYANDLSYNHSDGFFYTKGFSMVRYLYEFYGFEKLQELLKYKNELKLYSFKTAFKKVYKKDYKEFEEEWRRYVYTYYYGTAYDIKQNVANDSTFDMTLNSLQSVKTTGLKKIDNLVLQDSIIFLLGKSSKDQYYRELVWGTFDADTLALKDTLDIKNKERIKITAYASKLDISANTQYLGFVENTRYEHGSIRPTIFRYNRKEDICKKCTRGNLPQFTNEGGFYYQVRDHKNNYLKYFNEQINIVKTFSQGTSIGDLQLSNDEKYLAMTKFDESKKFVLYIYETETFSVILEKEFDQFPKKILWNNNELYITVPSSIDSRIEIYQYSVDSKKWSKYLSPPYNILPLFVEQNDSTHKLLVEAELDRDKRRIGKLELSEYCTQKMDKYHNNKYSNLWLNENYPNPIILPDTIPTIIKQKKYNAISDIKPFVTIPLVDDRSFSFMTLLMDPLLKHTFVLGYQIPYNGNSTYIIGSYVNKTFAPTISLSYAKYDWFGGVWEDKPFFQTIDVFDAGSVFPVNFIDNPFIHLNIGTGLKYYKTKMIKETFDVAPIFENGEALTAHSSVSLSYNLPYKNSFYHPIRNYRFSYNMMAANSGLGMKKDFSSHIIDMDIGFAPLYDLFGKNDAGFTFVSNNSFEMLNGDYFLQYQPGIDIKYNIPVGGDLITTRHYLRGIEETQIGNKLLISKNTFLTKISDDFNMSFSFGSDLLDMKYVGAGVWFDYGKLWQNDKTFNYKSVGYEVKSVINILGIPTIHYWGRAFNLELKELGYYYHTEIPLLDLSGL